jgi:hypothetical protein
MYELSEIGNLIVVISGALGSLLLIIFKSRCKSICFGCIKRDVLNDSDDENNNNNNVAVPVPPPAVPPVNT